MNLVKILTILKIILAISSQLKLFIMTGSVRLSTLGINYSITFKETVLLKQVIKVTKSET